MVVLQRCDYQTQTLISFWIVIFVCFAGLSLELKQEVPNTAPIVESLGFVMAQFFVVFVGIPRPRIYTLNERNLEIFIFVTETEHGCIHGITSPRMSKKPTIHEIWPREFKWFHSIRSILSTNDSILHQMFQICFSNIQKDKSNFKLLYFYSFIP